TQAGRHDEARRVWRRAAAELSRRLAENPDDVRIRMAYALALAGAGDTPENAIHQAKVAAEAIPAAKDAMDGPYYQAQLALVYLRTGNVDRAAEIVREVRRIPSIYYDTMFNLSAAWDALRVSKPAKK